MLSQSAPHSGKEHLAQIAVTEYANAHHNEYAQMRKVDLTVEQAMQIGGINRYIGRRPARSRPTIVRRSPTAMPRSSSLLRKGWQSCGVEPARLRRDCRVRAGHRPSQEGRPRCASSRGCDQGHAQALTRWRGVKPEDVKVAEIHDCFTVMGAHRHRGPRQGRARRRRHSIG